MRGETVAALSLLTLTALIGSCATTSSSEREEAPPVASQQQLETASKTDAPDARRDQQTPASKPAAGEKLRFLPESHTDFEAKLSVDSPEDKCYDDCLKRSQAVAMSWEAIQAQCRASCKKIAAAAPTSPPPPPPKRPRSKDRTCKSDRDCVVEWDPCGYRIPPCGLAWKRAVNREADRRKRARWANKKPACDKRVPCRRHPSRWLGSRAVCEEGQCSIR
jgi:hypothetical protein